MSTYKGAVLAMEEETTHVLEGREPSERHRAAVFSSSESHRVSIMNRYIAVERGPTGTMP